MSSDQPRRIWITGGSGGLGAALAEQLLKQGNHVALSVRAQEDASALQRRYPQLRVLSEDMTRLAGVQQACASLFEAWSQLDSLIINAGTCDYLDVPLSETFIERIARTNLAATTLCLNESTPLLRASHAPQVVGILNRFSSLQLGDPNVPADSSNNLAQLFEQARGILRQQGIALTVAAPQTAQRPITTALAAPQPWTAQQAAQALLQRLPERPENLVLEALGADTLWPLPA